MVPDKHDNQTADGLDEMLADFGDAMHSVEEEPTVDAKAFYDMLAASKERLHSFASVAQLTAVARLIAIKSQHNISAECINKLLTLLRGSAELPPIIPNLQDRPLIEPDGKN